MGRGHAADAASLRRGVPVLHLSGGPLRRVRRHRRGVGAARTRELDLTGPTRPTLRFSTWFDLERDYDYAFVTASTDGGKTWKTLPGKTTTTSDPNGANLGAGFTGKSGGGNDAKWIDEELDL